MHVPPNGPSPVSPCPIQVTLAAVLAVSLLSCLSATRVLAQADPTAAVDSALIERSIVEAKWRYAYTVHVESNTRIHEAGDAYDFYLYWRYDYTAEEYLNGEYSRKAWALAGDRIFYPFRNVKVFRVAQAGRQRLALEFTQPNSKGHYQYHFERVSDADAPFVKPVNQLPTVMVEGMSKPERTRRKLKGHDLAGVKEDRRWWPFRSREERQARRDERREARRRNRDGALAEGVLIEMTGGGFFGGIDPVMRDHTVIKPGGRLVKEFKTVQTDLRHTAADIDVEEYNRLVAFIRERGFFDLERVYDCQTERCVTRKRQKPTPVPLRIAVSDGRRKKVVNVAIWGADRRGGGYVDVPDELNDVIEAILKVSNTAEFGVAASR